MTDTISIIARGVTLRRLSRTQPLAPAVEGDIARIGDRVYARFSIPGRDGRPCVGVAELPAAESMPDVDPRMPHDIDLIGAAMGTTWVDYAGQIESTRRDRPDEFYPLGPEPEPEIDRFCREWPDVAARLKLQAIPPPPRLFAPGPVWRSLKLAHQGVDDGLLRRVLARHVAGDWGEYGRHADLVLTAAELWILPLLSVETQNRHAVRTPVSGAIRSRYRLEPQAFGVWRSRRPAWQADTVDVFLDLTTAVGPGPATMASLAVVPRGQ